MNEDEVKYPNVTLKGKRNRQKGETEPAHLRYGQTNSANRNREK